MDLRTFELFRDWLPVRLYRQGNRVLVDWCFVGKERLTQPFFDEAIERRFRQPFNLLFRHQTDLEFLGELHDLSKGVKPTGFIFHLSRCGSTLVSQMLAALERNIVISEAPPIDFVLRARDFDEERRVEWLRWLVNALGQKRNEAETNLYIKFDSWNAVDLALIRRAFPEVPWIFLYRNPVEIIVSQMRQRGAQMIPGLVGNLLPEPDLEESLRIPAEEYCARVLAMVCRSVLEPLKNGAGLPVNYEQLPAAALDLIPAHFGVRLTAPEIEKMSAATEFNAKNPRLNFTGDSDAKRKEASAEALAAAKKFVDPFYEEFEIIRKTAQQNRL